ncbi:gamma-aminobutyric acid type B receptor subunit 2-like [Saccoglossus kowalevskii]|uniref:Gamma-aminobutyric acid type B receptor subunit 2-like n=1 Tax=Saccoglossus kowalevskii TaxID=10224 RepID=A0ABM0M0H0_SACKO|nr:PREDICTED: gamma-aminobutyric acid type B receptor subunit 2-like [Saccoglossus kowalevskii]
MKLTLLIVQYFHVQFVLTQFVLAERKILHIGGLFISEVENTPFQGYNGTIRAAYTALRHINTHPDSERILQGYELQMTWQPSQCNPAQGIKALYDTLYNGPPKVMLYGPFCSTAAQRITDAAEKFNLVTFSYGGSSPALSDHERYPLFYRTAMTAVDTHNPTRVALLKRYRWSKVALITQNDDLFTYTVKKLLNDLHENEIDVLTSEVFNQDPTTPITNIKNKDARIIIGSFYPDIGVNVFCEAYRQGVYGPKYVWMIEGWFNNGWWNISDSDCGCTTDQLAQVAQGYFGTSWLSRNPNLSTINFGVPTTAEMASYFASNDDGPFSPILYDGIWALALTLNSSISRLSITGRKLEDYHYGNKDYADIISEAVQDVEFTGYTGHLSITSTGRKGVVRISQAQGDNLVTVGTYSDGELQLMEQNISWQGGDVPRDATQVITVDENIKDTVLIIFYVLVIIGITLSVGFLIFNIYYRRERIIRLSSPKLNNLIALGCIFVYTTVILLGVNDNMWNTMTFSLVCKLRVWTMTLGFTLAFGAMFVKTWRVHKIFTATKGRSKSLKVRYAVIEDEEMFVEYKRYTCESRFSKELTFALQCFKGLFLLSGVYLAWGTRNVTIGALNDSKYIGLSVYNVLILSIIALTVDHFVHNVTLRYISIATVLLIATTNTLCLVFVPKIYAQCQETDHGSTSVRTRRHNLSTMESTSAIIRRGSDTLINNQVLNAKQDELRILHQTLSNLKTENTFISESDCKFGCWINPVSKKCRRRCFDTVENMDLQMQTSNSTIAMQSI